MPSMEFNKIIGAVLLVLIVVKVADLAAGAGGAPKPMAKPAFVLGGEAATKPEATPEAKAEAKPDSKPDSKPKSQVAAIGPLLAAASADKGKSVARKCTICHSVKKGGKTKVGPALWGIVGAKKSRGSFRYSKALKAAGGDWDYAALSGFLKNPKAYLPGNRMTFSGIKRDGDRAALILYLRSLSDSPLPLP